jgi:hypothetical protein
VVGFRSAAGEPPHGERLRAEDLLAWQERLARFDEATPKPELLGFERLIAYEENAEFTYAFGQRTAQGGKRFPAAVPPRAAGQAWAADRGRLVGHPGSARHDPACRLDGGADRRRAGQQGSSSGARPTALAETNDPVGDPRGARAAETGAADEAATGDASGGLTRTVCLFQVGEANGALGPVLFESPADGADWKLTVRSGDRGLVVELPRNYVEAGWIASAEPGDRHGDRPPRVACRDLAAWPTGATVDRTLGPRLSRPAASGLGYGADRRRLETRGQRGPHQAVPDRRTRLRIGHERHLSWPARDSTSRRSMWPRPLWGSPMPRRARPVSACAGCWRTC